MAYNATVVNVVIASPGDVPAERDVVEAVVHRWNTMFSQSEGVVLVPRRWETSAAAEMGASAQSIINRQMIANGDILIGVFWTRLGTPTETHASGTAEEIEEFLANGRPASLFFSSMPAMLGNVDVGQWDALNEFREAMSQRGLIRTFESHSELSDAVLLSINHHVQQLDFSGSPSERPPPQLRDADPAADVRPTFVSLGGGRSILSLIN